jgi:hypothetical protein
MYQWLHASPLHLKRIDRLGLDCRRRIARQSGIMILMTKDAAFEDSTALRCSRSPGLMSEWSSMQRVRGAPAALLKRESFQMHTDQFRSHAIITSIVHSAPISCKQDARCQFQLVPHMSERTGLSA